MGIIQLRSNRAAGPSRPRVCTEGHPLDRDRSLGQIEPPGRQVTNQAGRDMGDESFRRGRPLCRIRSFIRPSWGVREWARMRVAFRFALALACWTMGCGAPAAPSDTGLVGTVVRGPVQPVCQVNLPCEAPFSASFTVQQGDRVVATFRSDSQGHFEVLLARGMYVVVAGPDAPIISPRAQTKEVVVGSNGLTTVLLRFDTGIR